MVMDWHPTDTPAMIPGALVPLQQHRCYAAACDVLGTPSLAFELRDGATRVATALVLVRRWPLFGKFALLSRGPVWHPDLPGKDRRAALLALVAQLRRAHRGVMVTPDRLDDTDPLHGSELLEMVGPGHMAQLPVRADADAQLAAMHGKWRNRLRRADRAGLLLAEAPMPPDPGHWLLVAEARQARARRYARLPPAFAAAWAARGTARLFQADLGGRPVAGMLFLRHGTSASYHVGWTSAEGRAAHAHTLLLWQAMLWAQRSGLTTLDLGTLDTDRAPDLARFKLGSGARPLRLGATRLTAPGTAAVARLARPWVRGPAGYSIQSPSGQKA